MKQEKLLQVIQAAYITEKSSQLAGNKQLVFKVDRNATKTDIQIAVESLLDVKVTSVNTVVVKGKTKRFRAKLGKRKDFKKAYVTLDKSVDMEALLSGQD